MKATDAEILRVHLVRRPHQAAAGHVRPPAEELTAEFTAAAVFRVDRVVLLQSAAESPDPWGGVEDEVEGGLLVLGGQTHLEADDVAADYRVVEGVEEPQPLWLAGEVHRPRRVGDAGEVVDVEQQLGRGSVGGYRFVKQRRALDPRVVADAVVPLPVVGRSVHREDEAQVEGPVDPALPRSGGHLAADLDPVTEGLQPSGQAQPAPSLPLGEEVDAPAARHGAPQKGDVADPRRLLKAANRVDQHLDGGRGLGNVARNADADGGQGRARRRPGPAGEKGPALECLFDLESRAATEEAGAGVVPVEKDLGLVQPPVCFENETLGAAEKSAAVVIGAGTDRELPGTHLQDILRGALGGDEAQAGAPLIDP